MEPTTGIEPVNLILTKDALYRLSYVGRLRRKAGAGILSPVRPFPLSLVVT